MHGDARMQSRDFVSEEVTRGLLSHCISRGKLVARVFGYILCDSFSAYISFGVSNILSQM